MESESIRLGAFNASRSPFWINSACPREFRHCCWINSINFVTFVSTGNLGEGEEEIETNFRCAKESKVDRDEPRDEYAPHGVSAESHCKGLPSLYTYHTVKDVSRAVSFARRISVLIIIRRLWLFRTCVPDTSQLKTNNKRYPPACTSSHCVGHKLIAR